MLVFVFLLLLTATSFSGSGSGSGVCWVDATSIVAGGKGSTSSTTSSSSNQKDDYDRILVVGSVNADTFLPVSRLPVEGENIALLPGSHPTIDVPGGKGCTQAVAAAKLYCTTSTDSDDKKAKVKVVSFVGQFGRNCGTDDHVVGVLQSALTSNGVDISSHGACKVHDHVPCGRGYVFITESGAVSAVISGGSNIDGWEAWKNTYNTLMTPSSLLSSSKQKQKQSTESTTPVQQQHLTDAEIVNMLRNTKCILLQREVPEYVNKLIATKAKQYNPEIIIFQDIGGEDRPMDREMMHLCDYIVPNETELHRLVQSLPPLQSEEMESELESQKIDDKYDQETKNIIALAQRIQRYSASNASSDGESGQKLINVLVTRGSRGSTLLTSDGEVIHRPAYTFNGNDAVKDETGAGDCYRAAFAVALLDGQLSIGDCMGFASAAGSCSVQHHGAVPSTPTRKQVMQRYNDYCTTKKVLDIPRGDGQHHHQEDHTQQPMKHHRVINQGNKSQYKRKREQSVKSQSLTSSSSSPPLAFISPRGGASPNNNGEKEDDDDDFPFMIGSRLNSMKDRPELYIDNGAASDSKRLDNPRDYVRRQALVKGLTCVDFNYPQHFRPQDWAVEEGGGGGEGTPTQQAKTLLAELGLKAGAVCLRYPGPKFARGAMNHPDTALRNEAIQLTMEAAQTALDLGCNEVVVWSAYDGYDYPFQVDYNTKWDELVDAFRQCCDAFPNVKFSLEYKPTDENTRFFTVASTGEAIQLVNDIDRPNMGLTLDVGHMLMSGENPAHSIAMVGRHKKRLFGIQLNDGYTRLAAEDGMIFGSIHPAMALEIIYQLREIEFDGHLYFDTFPQRTDPIREAEMNINRVKRYWEATSKSKLDRDKLKQIMDEHDAIGAIEIVDEMLRQQQ